MAAIPPVPRPPTTPGPGTPTGPCVRLKIGRDGIEVDTAADILPTAMAHALAAFDHIRATPAAPERLGPGLGFTGDRRTTPTVQPTAQQPYWRGRPPAPATAHTEEQQ